MKRARALAVMLCFFLPASRTKNWLLRSCGYDVHPTARVGSLLVVGVASLHIEKGVTIGPFNVMKNLREIRFESHAILGSWNWISGSPEHYASSDDAGRFRIGREAAVTSRHYVDATGGFFVGAYATVAGHRSTFITHGIDTASARQTCAAIRIGEFSLTSSNVKMVPGSAVPARSVIAMGSVVVSGLTEEYNLYAGVPARIAKSISPSSAYFGRTRGPVPVVGSDI